MAKIVDRDKQIFMTNDLPTILEIEQASFPEPWDEEDFATCLSHDNVISITGELLGKIVGYAIFSYVDNRICLINLAVDPKLKRTGIGCNLLNIIIDEAIENNRESIFATVSERNLGCHLFFSKMGFKAVGCHRDYYGDGHSAYEFAMDLK